METNEVVLKKFFKPNELADLLNVTPEAVRSWIFRGIIPVQRFGRCVRISRETVEKILVEGLRHPKN